MPFAMADSARTREVCTEEAKTTNKSIPGRARPRTWRAPLLEILAVLLVVQPTKLLAQAASGSVTGAVFSTSPHGEKYFLPGVAVEFAAVDATGEKLETTTEEQGKYAFQSVPPGLYSLKARSAGLMMSQQTVTVQAGEDLHVDIELQLETVKASVSVSAAANVIETTETTTKAEVQSSTLSNAPNVDERFESALPLLPGVVRGPDGLLNVKGARATQGGLLVNSTNVTDPYTGGSGMNLPIDVVSQVQVQANPYDSGYGKFAGAVTLVLSLIHI